MDTSHLQIVLSAEQHHQFLREASDGLRRHSSISDATMWTSEEFDPPQEQLRVGNSHSRVVSRGDSLGPMVVINELRSELAEIGQAYHHEVRAFRQHNQEISTRHTMQTHLAMIEQHSQFNEAALNYERVAATITEAAVAQERTEHRSEQQQRHYEYLAAFLEVQDRVRRRD